MPLFQTVDPTVEYPESDGKPMGETDLHIDWIIRIRDILRRRYRSQRVYVASDMIVYYREGAPMEMVVPDGFVVLDCEPHRRRTFKVWEEGKAPHVVFEVTSRSSKHEDEVFKPHIYARLGVQEYFIYDPSAEYLTPPLQGFRLEQGGYWRIEPDESGALACQALGLRICLEGDNLALYDLRTGELQRTDAEAERLAREAEQRARQEEQRARQEEQRARQEERAAREAAEARVAELQAEVERLRKQLRRESRS